jgi:NADP-reducing hydrogenase subunit HndB
MSKLKPEDLEKIKEKARRETMLREGAGRIKVCVHMGTCGIAAGARKIMSTLLDEVEKSGASDIIVTTSGCAGLCSKEPMITVESAGEAPIKYGELTEEKMKKIFSEHIIGGNVVKDYALAVGSETTH